MEIKLPDLAENMQQAVITEWHAKENDRIVKDQDFVEVETDKATFDVSAPCGGVLVKIMKKEGEKVRADEIIAEIREDGS